MRIFHPVDFFSKSTFSKKSFKNTTLKSNILGPDQALRFAQSVCKGNQQTTDTLSNY